MGRLFRLLITFGPMLYSMYKKFAGGRQTNNNLPQQQQPQNNDYGQQQQRPTREGTQQADGKWKFDEGENPLG